MKGFRVFLIIMFLLIPAAPAFAQPTLTGLQINEEIVPGPGGAFLTVTGLFSDGTRQQIREGLTWTASNTEIATVTQGGYLSFKGKGGPLTITVFKGGTSGFKTLTAKPWAESLDIETLLSYSDTPFRLAVKGRCSDGEVRYFGPDDGIQWTSSDPWVAWVNSQGVVTFSGENGNVSIKATLGQYYDTVNTTVNRGADGESSVFRAGIKIKEEIKYSTDPLKLTLLAVMSDKTEETIEASSADWSSSNTQVATVNQEGELKFTGKPGVATIKVAFGGYSYSATVTVSQFPSALSVNQTLNYTRAWAGRPQQLSATVYYNDGAVGDHYPGMSWEVDNKKVAAITPDGLLTFTGQAGKITVKVSVPVNEGTVVQDSVTTEVPAADQAVLQRFFIDKNPVSAGESVSLKAFGVFSDGSRQEVTDAAQWQSVTGLATMLGGEIFLTQESGPLQIIASYQGMTDKVSGYVSQLSGDGGKVAQLRIKEHTVSYSAKPVKLTALAIMGDGNIRDVSGSVQWHSSRTQVAKVKQGVVTFTGRTGKTAITVQGYGLRDQINLEVNPAELQPQAEQIVIEGELVKGANQLKVNAIYNDGTRRDVTQEVIWNSSNRNVALVSSGGAVMFPKGIRPVVITAYFRNQEASISVK